MMLNEMLRSALIEQGAPIVTRLGELLEAAGVTEAVTTFPSYGWRDDYDDIDEPPFRLGIYDNDPCVQMATRTIESEVNDMLTDEPTTVCRVVTEAIIFAIAAGTHHLVTMRYRVDI